METIERLREIVNRGTTTAEDKQFIIELSAECGIEFDPKKGCKNCFIDQAVILAKHLGDEMPRQCSARLRDDIDVIINGVRINNATLTDELVEQYRGNNLPEHWFV